MLKWIFLLDLTDRVTIVGILLTFIVSAISLYFSVRNNKTVHYVNAITKNRVEWIQKVRDTVAEFIAGKEVVYLLCENNKFIDSEKNMGSLTQCENKLILLLNFNDEFDNQLIEYINNINDKLFIYYRLKYFVNKYLLAENKDKNKILQMLGEYPVTLEVLYELLNRDFGKDRRVNIFDDLPISTEDFEDKNLFVITTMQIIASKSNSYFYTCMNYLCNADKKYKHDIDQLCNQLINKMQVYLKFEWNRVKIEASGKKYRKSKQKKDLKKLDINIRRDYE